MPRKILFTHVGYNDSEISMDKRLFFGKSASEEQNERSHPGLLERETMIASSSKAKGWLGFPYKTLRKKVDRALPANQVQVAVIESHGAVLNRGKTLRKKSKTNNPFKLLYRYATSSYNKKGETHHSHLPIIKYIQFLKEEKGITNFYIHSCYGGALIHDINSNRDRLQGVNITIHSSSKNSSLKSEIYTTGRMLEDALGKAAKQNQTDLTHRELSRCTLTRRLTDSSETTFFVNVSDEGEVSATKLRNPKEENQSKGRESQLEAFRSPEDFLEYLQTSMLVPVYLNERDSSNNRVALPKIDYINDCFREELERVEQEGRLLEIYKQQLRHSLISAINNNKTETIIYILTYSQRNGIDVINFQNSLGSTALDIAILGKRYDVVELLLDKGAKTEFRDICDDTPLKTAVKMGFQDIAELLIIRGAKTTGINFSKFGRNFLKETLKKKEKFEQQRTEQKNPGQENNNDNTPDNSPRNPTVNLLEDARKEVINNLSSYLGYNTSPSQVEVRGTLEVKLLEQSIANNQSNSKPPIYRGIGIDCDVVKINSNNDRNDTFALEIEEIFSPQFQRFFSLPTSQDREFLPDPGRALKGLKITGIGYVDRSGQFIETDNINNIFINNNEVKAWEKISNIFHSMGDIYFSTIDEKGAQKVLGCQRTQESVFVTKDNENIDLKNCTGTRFNPSEHGIESITNDVRNLLRKRADSTILQHSNKR